MKNTNNAVTISGSGKISAVVCGKPYSVENDHPNYDKIIDAIVNRDWDGFIHLTDISSSVKQYIKGDLDIIDGIVYYQNEPIHNTLTDRILDFMSDSLPFEPLVKFLENLLENPSKRAVDELYTFLEVGELPITEDGCFLAFKNVRSDYKDIHSGTFDNSVGKVCEMPRNKVCDNKDMTCSDGLHFCSISYLPSFNDSDGGKTMILKINPKDVVSIPADYNNTKGRCCRYEVVGEYTENWREKIGRGESGWDSPLYSSDGGEYEDDSEEDSDDDWNACLGDHNKPYDQAYEEYGVKPSGQKFYNVRGSDGKFVRKEQEQVITSANIVKALRKLFG
jgi:hypothetical protein